MSKVQDAVSAFESGFNCSQAIVRTYGPDYGLSALDSVRVSCGFGGGMRRGDTCGAVTGALMVLGPIPRIPTSFSKFWGFSEWAKEIVFSSLFKSNFSSTTGCQ